MKSSVIENKVKVEDASKMEAWERFKKSEVWAANASLPIMVRLFHVTKLMGQQMQDKLKLSNPQMRILYEALEPEGVSQASICKHYNIDPASVTRTAQLMEREGLITRHPDPADNRLMRVFISDKGRKLIEGMPQRVAKLEQELIEGWTDEEILQLHSLLERLEKRLGTII